MCRPGHCAPHTLPRQIAAQRQARAPDAPDAPAELAALRDWLLRLEAWRYGPPGTAPAPSLAALRREFLRLPWPRQLPPA